MDESTESTESTPQALPPEPNAYARLPERIRLEDTIAGQAPDAAPDPTMGRDPDKDFMLRNAL